MNLKIQHHKRFSQDKFNFLPEIKCKYGCICEVCMQELKKRSFGKFSDWKKFMMNWKKKIERSQFKEDLKLVNACNSVRKGPKYIQNTENYVIEVEGMSKWFVNKSSSKVMKILYDVNLKIKKGEFVVILGYSGSGKSTLLNVLSGIDRPSNGKVIIANHNLICLTEKELTLFRKDNLSFIFQNYALLPEFTVRENIVQGAELQSNVYKRLDFDELVDFLEVKPHLNKYPNQLSGGQQQRVAIVRSVIKNPEILFADEPTAAVDEHTAKNILQIFSDINKKYKTTIVLITHNPLIAKMGNRVIYIERGRIIKCRNQIPVPIEKLDWSSLASHAER